MARFGTNDYVRRLRNALGRAEGIYKRLSPGERELIDKRAEEYAYQKHTCWSLGVNYLTLEEYSLLVVHAMVEEGLLEV